ncbi:MAG: aminotransferase class V-fold PLP-dependent enzyme [Pseudorhodobacter sp.]
MNQQVQPPVILSPLDRFRAELAGPDLAARLAAAQIGEGVLIETPFGTRSLIYADHVASGRSLRLVEDFVMEAVLPYYANTHSQASYCGGYMTRLREAARDEIARICGAGPDSAVIFTGSGATAGLHRVVDLLDIPARWRRGERVVVLLGPYEHHSNLLPWRESGAEIQQISEAPDGGPDLGELEAALIAAKGAIVVGAFSAASNVTGIVTDDRAVTRLLKSHGALAIWDYAGGGPYLPMDMGKDGEAKDAIVFSSHKFSGGPGSSGVLICRRSLAPEGRPTRAGGGTVSFVSPWDHVYQEDLESREEAGTPNVIGDIRAALVLMIKEALGQNWISARNRSLRGIAKAGWSGLPGLEVLGRAGSDAIPVFSFRLRDGAGALVHHQLVTRMLSDVLGIQARGGCACAGPYAHHLLGMKRAESERIFDAIRAGREVEKPGWVRLNLSYLNSDAKAARIVEGVTLIARHATELAPAYRCDSSTARFQAEPSAGDLALATRIHEGFTGI